MYANPYAQKILTLVFGMIGTVALLIVLAIGALMLVASWKLLKKAGQPGWKCLIPIYGQYVMYKVCWAPKWFWITLLLGVAPSMLSFILADALILAAVVTFACGLACLVIGVIYNIQMARAYGKESVFALGLIFLPVIFCCILAFGYTGYVGPGGIPAEETV